MSTAPVPVDDLVVRTAVRQALRGLWTERADLVSEGVHERTVVAQLATRLASIVTGWDRRWQVDVEYNRWHPEGEAMLREKYLPDAEAGRNRRVYPDLIVHHPGHDGPEHNLLVLEAKRGMVSPVDRELDYQKLAGYLAVFAYRQAVFLEFDGHGGRPRLQWLTPHQLPPDPAVVAAEVVEF